MKSLLNKNPFVWATLVFLLVEITLFLIDGKSSYLHNFGEEPLAVLATLGIKLLVFLLLAFLYSKYKKNKKAEVY